MKDAGHLLPERICFLTESVCLFSRCFHNTIYAATCSTSANHLRPYMGEERHVDVTLFLVAEEDFRLYKGYAFDFLNFT